MRERRGAGGGPPRRPAQPGRRPLCGARYERATASFSLPAGSGQRHPVRRPAGGSRDASATTADAPLAIDRGSTRLGSRPRR